MNCYRILKLCIGDQLQTSEAVRDVCTIYKPVLQRNSTHIANMDTLQQHACMCVADKDTCMRLHQTMRSRMEKCLPTCKATSPGLTPPAARAAATGAAMLVSLHSTVIGESIMQVRGADVQLASRLQHFRETASCHMLCTVTKCMQAAQSAGMPYNIGKLLRIQCRLTHTCHVRMFCLCFALLPV